MLNVKEQIVFKIGGNLVMFWESYGAVCPSLCTTNGSIQSLANNISQHIKTTPLLQKELSPENWENIKNRDTITESILSSDLDFSNEEDLRNALFDAWNNFKQISLI